MTTVNNKGQSQTITIFVVIALLLVTVKSEEQYTDLDETCSRPMCHANNYSKPVELKVWKQCYPQFLTKYSHLAIINCLFVMLIGGLGNVLNLVAIPYVFFKYRHKKFHKFQRRWNQTTLLLLHLSFCDLAYVVMGIPFFLNIYINEGITFSNTVCWFSSVIRNWIANADFLTLGIIAYVKMRANFNDPETNCNPRRTFLQCCSTWVISFLIISPIVFEGDWFGIHWGKFGPVPNVAMCSTYSCPTGLPYYPVVYTVGFFLPLFTILISYLVVLPIKMKRIDRSIKRSIEELKEKLKEESDINRLHPIEDEHNELVDICAVNKALWMLFFAYLIFLGPLPVLEWLSVTDISKESLAMATIVGYNWYFWVYAINFIVYLASLKDFREMYRIFLQDCIHFMCSSKKNEINSPIVEVYTVTGKINIGFEKPLEYKTTNGVSLDFEINNEADLEFKLERSSSAPPCRRKRRFTENPRSVISWNGNKSFEPDSDMKIVFSEKDLLKIIQ